MKGYKDQHAETKKTHPKYYFKKFGYVTDTNRC